MPTYEVTAPDGQTYEIDAPDGATEDQVLAYAQQNFSKAKPEGKGLSKPAPKKAPGVAEQLAKSYLGKQVRGAVSTYEGLKQGAIGVGQSIAQGGPAGMLARYLAPANDVGQQATEALGQEAQRSRVAFDASTAGQSTEGQLTRGAAQYGTAFAIPGGGATVPVRIATAGLGGAASSVLAPVESGNFAEEKAKQAGVGAAAGVVGGGIGEGLRATGQAIGKAIPSLSKKATATRARDVLEAAATNPQALMRPAPSAVPGVQRTLAEESLDPGIAQLERQFPTQLAEQRAANNVARRAAIRQEFHGADDDAISAIQATRDAEAARQLKGLRSKTAPALDPVKSALDNLIDKAKGRPEVQKHLTYAKSLMDEGVQNADQAYNVRKTLDDMMNGRLGGDQASAKVARKELMIAKAILDREMSKVVPVWRDYLRGYRAASGVADEAKVGRKLLDASTAGENALTGERTLSADKFARMTNSEQDLVRSATKFARNKAQLQPGQRQVISNIRDDLSRQAAADTLGRASGSPTAQNLATGDLMTQAAAEGGLRGLLKQVPLVGGIAKWLGDMSEQKVNTLVVEMLKDPVRARTVLATLPAKQRQVIEARLATFSRPMAAASAAAVPQDQAADR